MGAPSTLVRTRVSDGTPSSGCAWCGQPAKYRYAHEPCYRGAAFCNLECCLTFIDQSRSAFDFLEYA